MRKRGFKSKLDLQKEIVELKKINKILTQEISSLKKMLGKVDKPPAPKPEKQDAKPQRHCVECNSVDFSFAKTGRVVFLVCKNCNNKEKL